MSFPGCFQSRVLVYIIYASIPFCFQPRARVGYAPMYFTPLDQSDELEVT